MAPFALALLPAKALADRAPQCASATGAGGEINATNLCAIHLAETVQIASVRMFVLASQGTQAPCVRQPFATRSV